MQYITAYRQGRLMEEPEPFIETVFIPSSRRELIQDRANYWALQDAMHKPETDDHIEMDVRAYRHLYQDSCGNDRRDGSRLTDDMAIYEPIFLRAYRDSYIHEMYLLRKARYEDAAMARESTAA